MTFCYKPLQNFETTAKNAIENAIVAIEYLKNLKFDVDFESKKAEVDFAFPAFGIAKLASKDPITVAEDIVGCIRKSKKFEKICAENGYVNFFIKPSALAETTITTIQRLQHNYGNLKRKNIKVIVEHTSANPTGPLHVGRARNPIIGDTLARILKRAGYSVKTEYYVNDVGKQLVTLCWGAENLKIPASAVKKDHKLVAYYQRAAELAETEQVRKEIELMLAQLEKGEERICRKVKKYAAEVLEGIMESVQNLNVKIDNFVWESEFLRKGVVARLIKKLKKLDICKQDGTAYYLDLKTLPCWKTRFYITRSDGTTLYTTRDLAYHFNKFERCDIAINVLGEDQKRSMTELKLMLENLGSKKLPENLFYSFVSLPEGRMSTRKGVVVTVDDLIAEIKARAYDEVKKRRPELSEKELQKIASIVGIGALRYNIIRIQPEKSIVFKWADALNFEGKSAPFIQYAHARACSILKKHNENFKKYNWLEEKVDFNLLNHEQECKLVRKLAQFPNLIEECALTKETHPVAIYAYELAWQFNQFYRDCPVLKEKTDLRTARLRLVDATRLVLSNALDTLGIIAPESM